MCFDNKVNSLLYVIRHIGRLPEEDEFHFEDGEDEREFFDKLAFINIVNSEELEKKPVFKVGYNLILETLDEYKIEASKEEKELIVEIFKQKLKFKKVLETKNEKLIKPAAKEIKRKEKELEQLKKKLKVKKLGGK